MCRTFSHSVSLTAAEDPFRHSPFTFSGREPLCLWNGEFRKPQLTLPCGTH
jgi:hypothetical protein